MKKMNEIVGFQGNSFILKCCERCGQIYRTKEKSKELCQKCITYLDYKASKGVKAHNSHAEDAPEMKLSITQIVRLASERGMSYGEYVAKYGTDAI